METDRCLLRRIRPDDCEAMYENWARYEEVCRYFPFHPVHDIEEYREKVNRWASSYGSGDYFHWVIEWKENGQLIGTINLKAELPKASTELKAKIADNANLVGVHAIFFVFKSDTKEKSICTLEDFEFAY